VNTQNRDIQEQDTTNGTSDDAGIPTRDLAGGNTPSVCVFLCGVMETEGDRQLHHLFTVSLCPYVHQTNSVHYIGNETLGTAAEIEYVCVSSYICQLGGIIHQSESFSTLSVSIGLVIGFRLNLAKKFLPYRRGRLCLSFLSNSWGCRGVCVS